MNSLFSMKAAAARSAAKEREDFQTMNTQGSLCPPPSHRGVVTHGEFLRNFQMEFIASNNCAQETLSKDTEGGWYRVGLMEEDKKKM